MTTAPKYRSLNQQEKTQAFDLRERGWSYREIADFFGRSRLGVQRQLQSALAPGLIPASQFRDNGAYRPAIKASPEAEADRDRRLAIEPADLTAALCGDPLPGYSALDRR